MKYLGPAAKKPLAYSVASVSGGILAVCSCTVLPLFAGIYQMGAGIGPASAFLYSGPAINVLAIVLTGNVLGVKLGVARAIGAIVFSILIGIIMAFLFEKHKQVKPVVLKNSKTDSARTLLQNIIYFGLMVGILVFVNWGKPDNQTGLWFLIYSNKWFVTAFLSLLFGLVLIKWFSVSWWKLALAAVFIFLFEFFFPKNHVISFSVGMIGFSITLFTSTNENKEWLSATYDFAKQILPLLFVGVFIAGILLGRPGQEGLIPSSFISSLAGSNSLASNFFASISGAFMYFATLTEVPIVEGLLGNGMEKGPALALLLAGPALSLPNMLVIKSVIGAKKTFVFVTLVVVMATITGMIFGIIYGG